MDRVTDEATGRFLTLLYNGDGRLSSISGPITGAVPTGYWVTYYGYDGSGNLLSVSYADGSGFDYGYADPNDGHNLTEKRDRAGHLLQSRGYDSQDRVTGYFSTDGKGLNVQYVSETQVDVTDAYGILRSYTLGEIRGRNGVTAMNGIGGVPYSGDNAIRWAYDGSMRPIEIETAGGHVTQYQDYDSRGNPGTVIWAAGSPQERRVSYTYHPQMSVPLSRTEPSVLGPGHKVTIWDYDNDGNGVPNEGPTKRLHRVIEQGFTRDQAGDIVPYEYITTLTYNGKGQILTIDGPRSGNDATTFGYDAVTGNLLSIARPIIGSTEFSDYDQAGRPGGVRDVNGQSRSFQYDGRGRVTSITHDSDGSATDISYNTAGQPQTVTDPDGIARRFDYDSTYGRLERITDPEGNYILYQYDLQGNRIEMSKHDPDGNRSSRKRWDYQRPNMPGRLWKEINADGSYTEYDYDSEGNVTAVTDPEGQTTQYDYDGFNRLIKVTQPGSVITAYAYDAHGNLISVTDAEGHETIYTYDDMGRLLRTVSPDTGTVNYVYDEAGNLIRKTDAKGIMVQYEYDELNRLTAARFPDATQDISYTYDAGANGIGNLAGIIDPSGSLSFGYDPRGRLTTRKSIIDGQSYTFDQSVTPGGRVAAVTYPSGRTLNYTRDAMGRMRDLGTTYNSTTVMLARNMTYNPFGGPKGLNTGSGGEVDNQSGECDCIEVVNPGSMMERRYTYDKNRNLLSITAPNTPWYNQTFRYDALNRLINAEGRYGSFSYTYDMVGNRMSRTYNGDTEDYTYQSGTNKLTGLTGLNPIDYTHDANGNITGIGTRTLVYNQNNRLIRVEENGNVLGEYVYNSLGQRVKKVVNGAETIFHYDLNGKLIAESSLDGTMTREYLYMGKIRMAMVDVASQSFYYFLNDRLGTPQLMTDNTGTVVWESIYKPFGEAMVHPSATVVNNLRFPGQYYDQETGLHYNYHRYYDPRTGRYLTPDPIGLIGGLNLFIYVENNPTNSTDPAGLHGPILIGKTPWYFRIPILRKFSRTPPPGGPPRVTQPRIKPASPRAKLQPPEKGAVNPSDRVFPHDPGADTPVPMGGIVPPVIIPEIQEDNPCEEQKPSTPWEAIPGWMKS